MVALVTKKFRIGDVGAQQGTVEISASRGRRGVTLGRRHAIRSTVSASTLVPDPTHVLVGSVGLAMVSSAMTSMSAAAVRARTVPRASSLGVQQAAFLEELPATLSHKACLVWTAIDVSVRQDTQTACVPMAGPRHQSTQSFTGPHVLCRRVVIVTLT